MMNWISEYMICVCTCVEWSQRGSKLHMFPQKYCSDMGTWIFHLCRLQSKLQQARIFTTVPGSILKYNCVHYAFVRI